MFDFAPQLSSTTSLSLSQVSSAAKFCSDSGIPFVVILNFFCSLLFMMVIIAFMLLQS